MYTIYTMYINIRSSLYLRNDLESNNRDADATFTKNFSIFNYDVNFFHSSKTLFPFHPNEHAYTNAHIPRKPKGKGC